MSGSSHFDAAGHVHMVDVSGKAVTARQAIASGDVQMNAATAQMIRAGTAKKGDVLAVARLAAIGASKLTSQLIPLCHALPLEAVTVDFQWLDPIETPAGESPPPAVLRCLVRAVTTAKTGVEMEAMTATAVACLTIYDMTKSVDREIVIGPIQLQQKSGGKSGDFRRAAP